MRCTTTVPLSVGSSLLDTPGTTDWPDAAGVPDEPALIRRAQRGDVDAYELLVRRYQGLAFRTAYVIIGDAGDAEDAAQVGFLKAWRALDRFEADPRRRVLRRRGASQAEGPPLDRPFRPWLLQIVANEARNRRAARGRHPTLLLETAAERPADAETDSPEASALIGERDTALIDALNALDADDRRVIACRYLLELSEAETAAALGIPRGTVKSRLFRALRRARALLEHPAGDGRA